MNELTTGLTTADLIAGNVGLPALFAADPQTAERVLDFFTANIRNANTRQAYARAVASFAAWCEARGLRDLRAVRPIQGFSTAESALSCGAEPVATPGEFASMASRSRS